MGHLDNIDLSNKETTRYHIESLLVKSKFSREIDYHDLLSECTTYIYKNKVKRDLARSLLEPFDENNDMDGVIIILCRDFVCDLETVKYIKNLFNDLSDIVFMLILLFQKRKNMNYGMIAENLISCYDVVLDNNDIDEILDNFYRYEESRNKQVCEEIKCYLESKRIFNKKEYEKPFWVNVIEGENISLLTSVPTGLSELSDTDVKFNKFLENSKNFFYEIVPKETNVFLQDIPEEIENSLRIFLETSANSEGNKAKIKLGNPNRVWGPMNKGKDRECCSGPEGEGPCRMLQCECLENADEDETYQFDSGLTWFTGKCDCCEKVILDLSHALRFPNDEGSWKGCYCSFECLTEDPPYEITPKSSISINIMRFTIEYYGIMDRMSFS